MSPLSLTCLQGVARAIGFFEHSPDPPGSWVTAGDRVRPGAGARVTAGGAPLAAPHPAASPHRPAPHSAQISPFGNKGDLIQRLSDSAKIYPPQTMRGRFNPEQTMRGRRPHLGFSHDAADWGARAAATISTPWRAGGLRLRWDCRGRSGVTCPAGCLACLPSTRVSHPRTHTLLSSPVGLGWCCPPPQDRKPKNTRARQHPTAMEYP